MRQYYNFDIFPFFLHPNTQTHTHIPLDGVKFKNRNLCNICWYARMKLFDPWKSSEASKTHSSSTSKPTSCMFTKHRRLEAKKKGQFDGTKLDSIPLSLLFHDVVRSNLSLSRATPSAWLPFELLKHVFLDETFFFPSILPMPITVHPSHLLLKLILNVFFFPSYFS